MMRHILALSVDTYILYEPLQIAAATTLNSEFVIWVELVNTRNLTNAADHMVLSDSILTLILVISKQNAEDTPISPSRIVNTSSTPGEMTQ